MECFSQHHANRLLVVVLFTVCASLATLTQGDVYKWTDDTGKVHFSDQKPDAVPVETVDIRTNSFNAPASPANTLPAVVNSPAVIMYSTARCGYCKRARTFFRQNNIPFREYDVETSHKGRKDFARLNGRGVPIILIGNQRMNGFTAEGFMALYRQSK
jgi:glutaredoxin